MNPHLDKMRALRAQIAEEIATLTARVHALQIEADTWDKAIAVASGADEPGEEVVRERRARGAVKDTALRLLQEHAEHGLTALELVEVAASQGINLDRGSISSLLSKLKAAGTLELDVPTSKYRPAPATKPTKAASLLAMIDGAKAA